MIQSAGGSIREVIIRLIAESAREENAKTFRDFAAKVRSVEDETVTVRKNGAAAQAKAVAEGLKKEQEVRAKTFREFMTILRQQQEAQKKAETAQKQVETAQKKATATYRQNAATLTAANDRMARGFKQSLSGAMSLGRGVAMLGLVGEKDTEKLLRGLIKIQAVFDVMRGTVVLVQGISRAWQGYTAAVTAAAAAQEALALAKAKAAFLGRRGARGAVGSLAAGGVGGAAGGAAVGGASMVSVAGTAALVGTVGAGLSVYDFIKQASKHGIGGGADPGSWSDRIAGFLNEADLALMPEWLLDEDVARLGRTRKRLSASEQARAQMLAQRQGRETAVAQEHALSARLRSQVQWDLPSAQRELQAARRGPGPGRGPQGETLLADQLAADARHVEAVQRVVNLRKEEYRTAQQTARESIRGAQAVSRSLEQQLRTHQQLAQQLREQGQTAMQRFGALGAMQQQQLLRIQRKHETGVGLSREEEGLLQQYGGLKTQETIAKRQEARAKELGWGAGEEYATAARKEESIVKTLEVRLKDQREMVVKLEREDELLANNLVLITKRLLDERDKKLREMFEFKLTELGKQQATMNTQRAGATGD